MQRHGDAVSGAAGRQRHGHVAAPGSSYSVAIVTGKQPGDLIAREAAATSYRDGFLSDEMQSDHSRHVVFIEVAEDGISYHHLQVVPIPPCVKMLWPSALASYPPSGASVTSKMISTGLIRFSSVCLGEPSYPVDGISASLTRRSLAGLASVGPAYFWRWRRSVAGGSTAWSSM